jgi:dUTP pyrophosphatase
MQIKMKKVRDSAIVPTRSHKSDACYDFYACEDPTIEYDKANSVLYIQYMTGWAIQPPTGYHTELYPRSSVSKVNLVLANSVGVIDEGYRGEILFRYRLINQTSSAYWLYSVNKENLEAAFSFMDRLYDIYKVSDRVGQMMLRRTHHYDLVEVNELSDTDRGEAGLGSTGR